MALYKLTDAPLWYDEMIEFYYSKYLTGQIRGVSLCNNLYERLQTNSFQPPLYNLIMHVWLLFGESEWWFRFSGVVFGLLGMLGLYACVKQFAGWQVAALSVFVSSFVYEWMYYVKEVAEYHMMIMLLYWLLYIYFKTFRNLTLKNIGWFTAVSVVLLYTQYGAVLAILPLAVSLYPCMEPERKTVWENCPGLWCGSSSRRTAIVFSAVPDPASDESERELLYSCF